MQNFLTGDDRPLLAPIRPDVQTRPLMIRPQKDVGYLPENRVRQTEVMTIQYFCNLAKQF